MSSRNGYLKLDERRAATALNRALRAAEQEIAAGQRDTAHLVATMRKILDAEPLASVDYAEIVDADTLEPVLRLRRACIVLLAVFVGGTRLIDNMTVEERDGSFLVSL